MCKLVWAALEGPGPHCPELFSAWRLMPIEAVEVVGVEPVGSQVEQQITSSSNTEPVIRIAEGQSPALGVPVFCDQII